MKKWGVAAVVIFGIWYFWQQQKEAALLEQGQRASVKQEVLRPEPALAANQKNEQKKPINVTPHPKPVVVMEPPEEVAPAGASPQFPPEGRVEFEVKENNLAVAFGDVVLGQIPEGFTGKKGYSAPQRTRLWPSAEIPFIIKPEIRNPQAIQAAMDYFHRETSIRFVPHKDQKDALVFVPSQELCASYLGRIGGGQPIFINEKCGMHEVMHELMHALGFVHEQSRVDRDKHVEIMWNNIDAQYWPQFWIVPDDMVHDYVGSVFSFDYESIMLYSPTAFAKEAGALSMRSRNTTDIHPTRDALSRTDKERLFYLYSQ